MNPFKKTTKKAEEGIERAEKTLKKVDETFEGINSLVSEMKNAVKGIKKVILICAVGMVLGITADIVSMTVSGRTIRIIKSN